VRPGVSVMSIMPSSSVNSPKRLWSVRRTSGLGGSESSTSYSFKWPRCAGSRPKAAGRWVQSRGGRGGRVDGQVI
jgi:hypothetical protein